MKKLSYIITALVVVAIFALFIQTKNQGDNSADVIRIGVVATLSGPGAYFGEQFVSGLNMARDDINANGGVDGKDIELIIEDSRTDNAVALTAAKKLVEIDKVNIVLGDSWNSTSLAMHPYLTDQKIILVSPFVSLDTFSVDDYAFRLIPSTKKFVEPIAEFGRRSGWRRVGFARAESQFSKEHLLDFESVSKHVSSTTSIIDEAFDGKTYDLRSPLTRLKAHDPDVIFNIHLSGPPVGVLIKQAAEIGLTPQWIGTWSTENSALAKEYSSYIEGMIYPAFYDPDESPTTRRFAEMVATRHMTLDMYLALGYDSLSIVADALGETDMENTDEVKRRLLATKNFPGVSGTFEFDHNGDVRRPIFLKTIKGGAFVRLLM